MKHPDWKQPNPKDQAVVLLSAIEGNILNCTDGVITPQQLERNTRTFLEQLRQLHKGWLPDKW